MKWAEQEIVEVLNGWEEVDGIKDLYELIEDVEIDHDLEKGCEQRECVFKDKETGKTYSIEYTHTSWESVVDCMSMQEIDYVEEITDTQRIDWIEKQFKACNKAGEILPNGMYDVNLREYIDKRIQNEGSM